MIMDCGKPMIIGPRARALLRHARADPYCRALISSARAAQPVSARLTRPLSWQLQPPSILLSSQTHDREAAAPVWPSSPRTSHQVEAQMAAAVIGERLEAGGSTSEQNTLPFALPSWNTAKPRTPLPVCASDGGLSGAAASPTATQLPIRDVTGGLGSGAPDSACTTSQGLGANIADHDHQMIDSVKRNGSWVSGWQNDRPGSACRCH